MVLITNEAEVIVSDSVNSANNQQANNAKLKQMNLSSFIKPITAEKRLEDVDLESLRMDLDKVLRDEPPKAAPTDKKSAARIRQQKSRKRKEIQEVDDGIRDPVTMKKNTDSRHSPCKDNSTNIKNLRSLEQNFYG
jgi:hypothetical protein